MVKFIPVRYQSSYYPDDIQPQIQEVTCNFGTDHLERTTCLPFLSLHTDPSIVWEKYVGKGDKRKPIKDKIRYSKILPEFPTIFKNFNNLLDSGADCVSILWSNESSGEQWGKEFAGFLVRLTEGIDQQRIKIIEIHSPFDRYCGSLDTFIKRYEPFEKVIVKTFPSADIVIENQYTHKGKRRFGNFLLSNIEDIQRLSGLISDSDLKLRLVLDIPQLLSAYYDNNVLEEDHIKRVLDPLIDSDIRNNIRSTHIWGYDINKKWGAHKADLNMYFGNNSKTKRCFLEKIHDLFNDGKRRYFVPEVSSDNAIQTAQLIQSIVKDLKGPEAGVVFVDPD